MSSIVIIGPAHPLRGGIAAFNERLAQELQRNGHEVVIFSFSLQYPSFLFPGKTQYSDSPVPEGLKILTEINSVNPASWMKVGREIKKKMPDLVIVRFWIPFMAPCLGSILRQIRKNKHSKIICIADNILPHERRTGDRALTNYFVSACDSFVVMSSIVEKDLKTFTSKPIMKNSHPLYDQFGSKINQAEARKHLNISEEGKWLLFFGLVRHYKGLDLLVQAMADTRIQQQQIKLIVAGEFYEDENIYRKLIKKNHLEENIILFNCFIPDAEVKYFFSAANVVILPYREATQSGIAPIAYQMETPMIVTNVGGLPDTVENGITGFICDPQPASIAKAILTFYDSDENQFAPFIREAKKQYSWESFTDRIIEFGLKSEKRI